VHVNSHGELRVPALTVTCVQASAAAAPATMLNELLMAVPWAGELVAFSVLG
jgi:hypothetical protein